MVTILSRDFREISPAEKALLRCLLRNPFPGSSAISAQLTDVLVRSLDDNGSLEFKVTGENRASVSSRIPVEGEGEDVDGTTIHVLLHVTEGKVRELEVYKNDSSNVIRFPECSKLRIFIPQVPAK